MIELPRLVVDFAASLRVADRKLPQAIGVRTGRSYQPGIGPHTEAQTLGLVVDEMVRLDPRYSEHALGVRYGQSARQVCDWCLGRAPDWEWAIEAKLLRLMGDNGKPNDNMLMHVLSPYPAHRSAVTDCFKLAMSTLGKRKAVMIVAYDYEGWPAEPAIDAFEALAGRRARLGTRHVSAFDELAHPVHRSGAVFLWEIEPA